MKFISPARVTGCAVACVLLFSTASVSADPIHKSNYRNTLVHSHRVVQKAVVRPVSVRTVTTVSALGLNRLPVGYVRFLHGDETFYYSEGLYYQKKPHGYVIVKPRTGFRVATLPRGYRTIRSGNTLFYSFNNVRYRKVGGFFIVV